MRKIPQRTARFCDIATTALEPLGHGWRLVLAHFEGEHEKTGRTNVDHACSGRREVSNRLGRPPRFSGPRNPIEFRLGHQGRTSERRAQTFESSERWRYDRAPKHRRLAPRPTIGLGDFQRRGLIRRWFSYTLPPEVEFRRDSSRRCSSMVEHGFRKAGVVGSTPTIGFFMRGSVARDVGQRAALSPTTIDDGRVNIAAPRCAIRPYAAHPYPAPRARHRTR